MEFLKDLQPTWPIFVLPRWEGLPDCEGYVHPENITIVEPEPTTCDELIINGDMEQGLSHWLHRNDRDVDRGTLTTTATGIDNSTAIKLYDRYSGGTAIGQNLDTRCLHQRRNEFYEIELNVRLEKDNVTFICDPFSSAYEVRCPYVNFRTEKNVNETIITTYSGNQAAVVIPNGDVNGFNLVHGVFKVDDFIHSVERLYMFLEQADPDYDYVIDNASVHTLPGICHSDLIRNGNFDVNDKYWSRLGAVHVNMENGSIKVFSKPSNNDGIQQHLFVDKGCFEAKQRYHVTGKMK